MRRSLDGVAARRRAHFSAVSCFCLSIVRHFRPTSPARDSSWPVIGRRLAWLGFLRQRVSYAGRISHRDSWRGGGRRGRRRCRIQAQTVVSCLPSAALNWLPVVQRWRLLLRRNMRIQPLWIDWSVVVIRRAYHDNYCADGVVFFLALVYSATRSRAAIRTYPPALIPTLGSGWYSRSPAMERSA